MNNKYINAIFYSLFLCCFLSCNSKEDAIFCDNTKERVSKLMDEYIPLLQKPEYGWKFDYTTITGQTVKFIAKFIDDQRVVITSSLIAGNSESSWTLKSEESIILSFDSFNDFLHTLADPGVVPEGYGFQGDFEFIFDNINEDQISFVGRKYRNPVVFNIAEEQDWKDLANLASYDKLIFGINSSLFRVLVSEEGEGLATFIFDRNTKSVDIYYIDEDGESMIRYNDQKVKITGHGLEFDEELNVNGVKVKTCIPTVEGNMEIEGSTAVLYAAKSPTVYKKAFAMAREKNSGTVRGFSMSTGRSYAALLKEFPDFVSLMFMWNVPKKNVPGFAAVLMNPQRMHFVTYNPQMLKRGKNNHIILFPHGYFSVAGTQKELAKMLKSKGFLGIMEFSGGFVGCSIIPHRDPNKFYLVSKTDPMDWILIDQN